MSTIVGNLLTGVLIFASLLAHELAHGYAALWCGDDTARRAGRLTWNPAAHIDPMFSILLPVLSWFLSHGIVVFGGARPIPVNPFLYRGRRDRADLIVSLAGVAANACIALVFVSALPVFSRFDGVLIARRLIAANIALIVFNLLPVRPFDGWRVLECIRRARRRSARGL